jgi:hypothetical protein
MKLRQPENDVTNRTDARSKAKALVFACKTLPLRKQKPAAI